MTAPTHNDDTPPIIDYGTATSSQETVTSHSEIDSGSGTVVVVAYSLVVIVSIVGNGLVVLTIVTCRRMRSATNYFIANLAGADLLMGVGVPFSLVANWLSPQWPFGHALCPVIPYLQAVAVFLSALTLVGLSIDRFRAVVFPLRPRMTGRQAAITIGHVWFLSAAFPLPVAVLSRVDPDSGLCVESWPSDEWQYTYTISIMALQYFVPLGVLTVTYATICYVIWVKKTPGEAENFGHDRRLALAKRKTVKTMVIVVVIYALCWLPLHCITLLGDLRPAIWQYRHIKTIWTACHWLAMSSCCWNPVVYCWTNESFRDGFVYAILGRCPGGSDCATAAVKQRRLTHRTLVYDGAELVVRHPIAGLPEAVIIGGRYHNDYKTRRFSPISPRRSPAGSSFSTGGASTGTGNRWSTPTHEAKFRRNQKATPAKISSDAGGSRSGANSPLTSGSTSPASSCGRKSFGTDRSPIESTPSTPPTCVLATTATSRRDWQQPSGLTTTSERSPSDKRHRFHSVGVAAVASGHVTFVPRKCAMHCRPSVARKLQSYVMQTRFA